MRTYQYILLDWDGNLAKTLDVWLGACRITLEKRGLVLSDEDIASSLGQFRAVWQGWGVDDVEAAIQEADQLAKKILPNAELYPGALEVLETLHASGKQLAIITSSYRDNVERLLEKYNLAPLFQTVIAAEDITHHKPHPEPLQKALDALGGNPAEAIMIGDSDKDIGAANNLGMDSILFHSPDHKKFYDISKLKQLKPTHIVEDFRQVLKIV